MKYPIVTIDSGGPATYKAALNVAFGRTVVAISGEEGRMADLKAGDIIAVPCDVGGGAFLGEKLITIDTVDGPISGFVSGREVREESAGRGFIPGTVLNIEGEILTVRISGSFFTTTGLAQIPMRGDVHKLESAHH